MTPIHPFEHGARARPAVVCLHATGGTGGQWKALASKLQRPHRVLTPDLYGHGTAPAWLGTPTDIVAADTARIAQLIAGAAARVHLVGHSYGGTIALRVALARPERVASVTVYEPVPMRVLFDFNPKQRATAEVAEVAADIGRALNGGRFERAAQRFVDYWSGAGQWDRLAPEQRAAIASRGPLIRSHFAALVNDTVRLRDYARVDVPVLYLAGRETRASARRIAELMTFALPRVDFEMLDGMGHLGPITHAEIVVQRIIAFLRRQTATPTIDDRAAA